MDQLLHDFGYFGENVICNYARQITHGIVFLHESGIIHRDLKGTYTYTHTRTYCMYIHAVVKLVVNIVQFANKL